MKKSPMVAVLFLLSGAVGLAYEIIWIRLFSIAFGNSAQALSTVLAVFLGGLALGAFLARNIVLRPLRAYGWVEVCAGLYTLATPWLIRAAQPLLREFYGDGHGGMWKVAMIRAVLCSAILLPATTLMGATLPLLAEYLSNRGVALLYTVNLAGATAGALLCGFALLPSFGYSGTLRLACGLNMSVGLAALWLSRKAGVAPRAKDRPDEKPKLVMPIWIAVSFLNGAIFMIYEVAWSRMYALLFGPTASTITLVLATFLAGLTLGAIAAARIRNHLLEWLCAVQFLCAVLLVWTFIRAGGAPLQVAEWVKLHSGDPFLIERMKVSLLSTTLLPLTIALGLVFPLILRFRPNRDWTVARAIGGMYGTNTTGCIGGSLLTGWVLIPLIGTERTLLLGCLLSLGLGLLLTYALKPGYIVIAAAGSAVGLLLTLALAPRWNMTALTAGAYKYAPYYASSDELAGGPFNGEQVAYLHEGESGTVSVRKSGGSTLLSIDGKVDASDAGGDLLTEKLLAHLPLYISGGARKVCLVGLASGVTAGAALTHSLQSLDVVEISDDVVKASQLFGGVNHDPLADPRTTLIVNDGRNHLGLTAVKYDVIISEPSNPWIAGMNNLFTENFFRIARSRLNSDGVFAQWFHLYNLPMDDLRSLFRAFTEVFPSAILWQLNDGDVLLTGFMDGGIKRGVLRDSAVQDLASVGVSDPALLLNMYLMRDGDLTQFAAGAQPNTDDDPRLEFHGQRDLHAQTDASNSSALAAFHRELNPPAAVQEVRTRMSASQLLSVASMFEHAESFRSAYQNYRAVFALDSRSREALSGMDRCARLPAEHAAVAAALHLTDAEDTLERRTELALAKAREGDVAGAEFLFEENAQAHPLDSSARLNYGLFCLERMNYQRAIEQFRHSIELNPNYLPAYEAMAESYLQLHDSAKAVEWSRRILQIDPNHQVARETLARLDHQ